MKLNWFRSNFNQASKHAHKQICKQGQVFLWSPSKKGSVHKWRHAVLRLLTPLPTLCHAFYLLELIYYGMISWPPPPKKNDVIYECPQMTIIMKTKRSPKKRECALLNKYSLIKMGTEHSNSTKNNKSLINNKSIIWKRRRRENILRYIRVGWKKSTKSEALKICLLGRLEEMLKTIS